MTPSPLTLLKKRWTSWWDARLPRSDELTLTHRNLYILPTRVGWVFALVLLVLLLGSINERINLGYGLAFLLGSSALAAAHLTHGNLQGMQLHLQPMRSVHAGEALQLSISLRHTSPRDAGWGLRISSAGGAEQQIELQPGCETLVTLDVPTTHRGWMRLPRLTLASCYPLGFFRAWAYWRPLGRALIWPALEDNVPPLPHLNSDAAHGATVPVAQATGEIQEGLRDYRRGDPLRSIAWRKSSHAIASGSGLVSRTSEQSQSENLWLDYHHSMGLSGLSKEARVSRLASWLILAEERAQVAGGMYGLRLPGVHVACGCGGSHLQTCMNALATWSNSAAEQT